MHQAETELLLLEASGNQPVVRLVHVVVSRHRHHLPSSPFRFLDLVYLSRSFIIHHVISRLTQLPKQHIESQTPVLAEIL